MRVYRIARNEYINDLSGEGAYLHGGRWNSKGTHALYTSSSKSLALLELLVHTPSFVLKRGGYSFLTLEFTPGEPLQLQSSLPNKEAEFGDSIIKNGDHLSFMVASVIVPDEANYVLNPKHRDFSSIKIISTNEFHFDPRLYTIK